MIKNNRIKEIFTEAVGPQGASGGIGGFQGNTTEARHSFRRKDAKRKQIERQGVQRNTRFKKLTEKDNNLEDEINPREGLMGPTRLTLKETFGMHLYNYLKDNKYRHIYEALQLMEEYPKLKEWVIKESIKSLPSSFNVFKSRLHLDEEVGVIRQRSGEDAKIWHLSEQSAIKSSTYDMSSILEAKISNDHVLINIPVFTNLLEEMIFNRKIDDIQEKNVIREAKNCGIIVTTPSINEGMVTKIHRR